MPHRKRPENGARLQRAALDMRIRAIEGDERRFELSFSSEVPYTRWGCCEILDHSAGAVDLARLQSIGVALFNHHSDEVIGKLERVRIENRRGVCEVVFDEDEASELIRAKVAGGTLKATSVGYAVHNWEKVEAGQRSLDGRFTGPCWIAKKWEPLEVSIVAVPADPGVGVGRSDRENENGGMRDMGEENMENQEQNNEQRNEGTRSAAPPTAPAQSAAPSGDAVLRAAEQARQAEQQRIAEITEICTSARMDAAPFIRENRTVEQVRAAALDQLLRSQAPVSTGARVTRDAGDKFIAAATDALSMRHLPCGVSKPAEGARELRGFSLQRLAERALQQDGENTQAMDNEEIASRAFLAGDGSFSAIMDQTAGKIVRDTYEATPTTYQQWARIGSLSDFKKVPTYRLGEADSLVKVPMSGELPQGKFVEQKPFHRSLDTYGKTVGISRQMLINDDIGQFARLAVAYAQTAARDINRAVYKLLTSNPTLEIDGRQIFDANHGNVGTAGRLNIQTLGELRKLIRLQKGVDRTTVLNLAAEHLLVPASLEMEALQLLRSNSDPGQDNSGVINPLQSAFKLIADAEMDAVSETAFYAAANSAVVDTIGVDFLNGQNQITIRQGDPMGQLGRQWDIYIDYGVYAGDYRGLARNAGA